MLIQVGDSIEVYTERGKQLALCRSRIGNLVGIDLPPHFAMRRGVDFSPGRIVVIGVEGHCIVAEIIDYKAVEGEPAELTIRIYSEEEIRPDLGQLSPGQPQGLGLPRQNPAQLDGPSPMVWYSKGEYSSVPERVILETARVPLISAASMAGYGSDRAAEIASRFVAIR